MFFFDHCFAHSRITSKRKILNHQKETNCLHNGTFTQGFPGGSLVKNLLAMQETQVQSLGQEDSPGEENGNPFQYCCLEIPWTEELGRLQSMGSQELDMTQWLYYHHIYTIEYSVTFKLQRRKDVTNQYYSMSPSGQTY